MKNIIISLSILIALIGCEKDKTESDSTRIDLLSSENPILFNKSVLLYDNNDYNIKTPLDTFLIGYPFSVLSGYGEMESKAIIDSTKFDVLNVKDYMKNNNDSVYTLAYYLENGNCLVFDKKTNTQITSIIMERYFTGVPLASSAGRRFYIHNELFLETIDLISK